MWKMIFFRFYNARGCYALCLNDSQTLLSMIETRVPKSANMKIISDGWASYEIWSDAVALPWHSWGTSTLPSYTKLNLLNYKLVWRNFDETAGIISKLAVMIRQSLKNDDSMISDWYLFIVALQTQSISVVATSSCIQKVKMLYQVLMDAQFKVLHACCPF